MGSSYWSFMVNNYMTNPAFQEITDRKYGEGASEFYGEGVKGVFRDGVSGGWSERWMEQVVDGASGREHGYIK